MRISHTIGTMEMQYSGVTICVEELLKHQQDFDNTVNILTLHGSETTSSVFNAMKIFNHDLGWCPTINRLHISKSLKNYLLSNTPEVIHTHGLWSLINTYRKPKQYKDKSIFAISPHGMLSENSLTFSPKKKQLFNYLYQKKAFDDADLVFATSESEYIDIRRFGIKQPVAIVPCGVVAPKELEQITINDKKYLLSLTRIHPKKGLDDLIHAWSNIENMYPDWELKIVGPDSYNHRKTLETLIANKSLKRVTIQDAVYGDRKRSLMRQASIFIVPSKNESFGMTVTESLAVGVPVIASEGTPWESLIKQNCGWWVPCDIDGLTKILQSTFNLPDVRLKEMGENGRKWVAEEFSWKDIARRTVEAYQWALNKDEKPEYIRIE